MYNKQKAHLPISYCKSLNLVSINLASNSAQTMTIPKSLVEE